jgi:hypothetical protein
MSGYRFHDEAEAAQLAAIAEAEGTRRREPNGHGAAAASNFPTILVKAGERYLAADAGLKALHAAGTPFYQRDRALVRVCEVKARSTSGEVILVPGHRHGDARYSRSRAWSGGGLAALRSENEKFGPHRSARG